MLKSGDIINDTYMIDSEIGSGALGVVYKAVHIRLEKYVVLKKIKADKVSYGQIRIEVDTLKQYKHAYLPNVYDYLEYEGDIYTVMDYIDGYDLKKLMERGYIFTQQELIKWLRQLCSVLNYLHTNKMPIVHSDIKPDNILIDSEGNVCLIDFNIAGGFGMTREYASPEQFAIVSMYLMGDPNASMYSIDGRSDIYSLGVTFYYLMTSVTPDVQWYDMPRLTDYEGLAYSETFIEIVEMMKCRDINKRFQSAQDILRALDNIKWRDSRYKRYILMQIFAAIIFVVLLVFGVRMILHGFSILQHDEFYTEYDKISQSYEKGDYQTTIDLGYDLLNSSKYQDVITDGEIGQIFYIMGNCAYDDEDYSNAAYYFEQAYKYIDKLEIKSDLYTDYAAALAKSDRISEAESIVEQAENAQVESSKLLLAKAEIAYMRGDYSTALSNVIECIKGSNDDIKTAKCYLLMADIYDKVDNYTESIKYYKVALEYTEAPNTYRKLSHEYIKYNNQKFTTDNVQYNENIKSAERYLRVVYEKYVPNYVDYLNLGELNKTLKNYDFSLKVISEGLEKYPNDYKLYLYMALTYEAMGDIENSKDNVGKAMQYYKADGKNDADYDNLMRLYSLYFSNGR